MIFVLTLGILVTPMRVPYIIIILQKEVPLPPLVSFNERSRGSEGALLFRLFLTIYTHMHARLTLSILATEYSD